MDQKSYLILSILHHSLLGRYARVNEMVYKSLNDGCSSLLRDCKWVLGEWQPKLEGELVPCERGYHLCRPGDIVYWIGPELYEAEYRGEVIEADTKIVVREARIVRRIETWGAEAAEEFATRIVDRWAEKLGQSSLAAAWRARDMKQLSGITWCSPIVEQMICGNPFEAASGTAYKAREAATYSVPAVGDSRKQMRKAEAAWQTEQLFDILGEAMT